MSTVDEDINDLLLHYGVKGMKWGVRRDTRASSKRYRSYNKGLKIRDRMKLKKMSSSAARQKYLDDKDQKWIAKVKDDKNIQKVVKRTNKELKKANKELKEQFGGRGLKGDAKRAMSGRLNADYHKAMKDTYNEILADSTFSVYKLSPSRIREVSIVPNPDGTFKATVVERNNPKLAKQRTAIERSASRLKKKELRHAATDESDDDVTDLHGMTFIILPDEDGFPDEVVSPFDVGDEIKHSAIDKETTLQGIDDEYKQLGREVLASILGR